jgi:hypothetical protein
MERTKRWRREKGRKRTLRHDLPVHRRLRVHVEDGVPRVPRFDKTARSVLDLLTQLAVGHRLVRRELEELPRLCLGRLLAADGLGDLLNLLVYFDDVPPSNRNLRRPFSHRSCDEVGDYSNGRDRGGDESVGGGVVASGASSTGCGGRTDLLERKGVSGKRSARVAR